MGKYRKKPVVIDAILWDGTKEAAERLHEAFGYDTFSPISEGDTFDIKTLEGVMTASVGDYIIKGIEGEFYSCKPNIFEKSYTQDEGEEAAEQAMVNTLPKHLAHLLEAHSQDIQINMGSTMLADYLISCLSALEVVNYREAGAQWDRDVTSDPTGAASVAALERPALTDVPYADDFLLPLEINDGPGSWDIRWVQGHDGSDSNYPVRMLHETLQQRADYGGYPTNPSTLSTKYIVELHGTFNIDEEVGRHLRHGTVLQRDGGEIYLSKVVCPEESDDGPLKLNPYVNYKPGTPDEQT